MGLAEPSFLTRMLPMGPREPREIDSSAVCTPQGKQYKSKCLFQYCTDAHGAPRAQGRIDSSAVCMPGATTRGKQYNSTV